MNAMWTREELWEQGVVATCPRTGRRCRWQPCTTVQDVDCCAECLKCGQPCPLAERKGRR